MLEYREARQFYQGNFYEVANMNSYTSIDWWSYVKFIVAEDMAHWSLLRNGEI